MRDVYPRGTRLSLSLPKRQCPAQGRASSTRRVGGLSRRRGFFVAASAVEVSSGSPLVSFCSILASSSGSGLRSRACDHWNCASSVRPILPVGVAEVIVDGRILGLELDRALEVLHRLVVVAEPEIGPAERVDDVAVIRPLLDGAADHPHALVEIDALIDPRIAEIVQHVRLVGIELERLLQVGSRPSPTAWSARCRCRGSRRSASSASPAWRSCAMPLL